MSILQCTPQRHAMQILKLLILGLWVIPLRFGRVPMLKARPPSKMQRIAVLGSHDFEFCYSVMTKMTMWQSHRQERLECFDAKKKMMINGYMQIQNGDTWITFGSAAAVHDGRDDEHADVVVVCCCSYCCCCCYCCCCWWWRRWWW